MNTYEKTRAGERPTEILLSFTKITMESAHQPPSAPLSSPVAAVQNNYLTPLRQQLFPSCAEINDNRNPNNNKSLVS